MKILAIETSFDEAGLAVVDYKQNGTTTSIQVLSDILFSQAKDHEKYGGVYPTLAKQLHAKNLVRLLTQALTDAGMLQHAGVGEPEIGEATKTTESIEEPVPEKSEGGFQKITDDKIQEAKEILHREPQLFEELMELINTIKKPRLDAIAVTHGPGLEPALWVGISFAKALSILWDIPLSPVNHMEGHIAAALACERSEHVFDITVPSLPSLALLISGAHTELVLMKKWLHYERIGSTRDDAVGEAFDKTARLLGLGYPGGPIVSKLASFAREQNLSQPYSLPRPMLTSDDYDFSLSGLKTAVRILIEKIESPTPEQKQQIAREFEDAVTDVLVAKTKKAIEDYGIHSLIVSGGVAANEHITKGLENLAQEYDISFYMPTRDLATDNGRMIAFATAINNSPLTQAEDISANGNLKLY